MRKRLKKNGLILWRTYVRWTEDDGPLMSAAVAYYIGLSLFPLLLLVIAGLGMFFQHTSLGQDSEKRVIELVAEQGSPTLAKHVQSILSQVQDRSGLGSRLGILGFLITSIAGFTQFQRAFDHIWGVPMPPDRGIMAGLRHTLIERGVAFLMLLATGLLVVVVFVAGLVISTLEHVFQDQLRLPGAPGPLLRVLTTIFLNTCLFSLLYRLLPPVKIRWIEALRAGMFSACGWELGRMVLAQYVINTRYTNAYGVVGSFLGVLLWCYYAVAIIFLGGEYLKETCQLCDLPEKKAGAIPESATQADPDEQWMATEFPENPPARTILDTPADAERRPAS